MLKCDLHSTHHPAVVYLHLIHINDEPVRVCGTGLDNLYLAVNYMRDGGQIDGKIGRETWDLAQRILKSDKVDIREWNWVD